MLSITHKLAPPSSVLLLVESLGDDLSIVRDARTRQRTDDRGRSAEGSSGQSGNHGGIREASVLGLASRGDEERAAVAYSNLDVSKVV